jgi:hypothetical protein
LKEAGMKNLVTGVMMREARAGEAVDGVQRAWRVMRGE